MLVSLNKPRQFDADLRNAVFLSGGQQLAGQYCLGQPQIRIVHLASCRVPCVACWTGFHNLALEIDILREIFASPSARIPDAGIILAEAGDVLGLR